ncbi:MAG TPA: efflux RND transporter periplasmic adaptor subunit [Verrucomicrobiota bacterium]|nr:efflux RND transporter periplasmic adaptor subunit [Verrucomicrobiales bacterium]HRI13275.1 efflux RND transporter periplasmic adaptor subunit [Verrucomicrobiota bacterium]
MNRRAIGQTNFTSKARYGWNGPGRSAVVALSVICFAAGCSRPEPVQSRATRPVKTLVVAAGEDTRERLFSGRVEASRSADLAFSVSGVLVALPIKEGQRVAKGEVIAQLREEEFKARLQTLQGQLDQARAALRSLEAGERPEERLRREAQVRASEARLANARIDFERMGRLVQTQAVSRAEFDQAETMYRVAQEDLKAALQTLEMGTIGREEDIEARAADVRGLEGRVVEADLQLRDTTLRAPYDGVIARRFVDVKQNVRAKEPVVRFQDADEIDIAVDVPEALMMSDIRTADIVQMYAELSGAPGVQIPVRIREVSQVADPTTQTFNVRVALKAPPGITVLPGMSATVALTYRRAGILGNRILVPISAVYKDSAGEQVVWVLGPEQTVARRPVKTGEATGSRIEIVDGLQPGNRIAIAGVSFLRDGMKVRDLGDALGGAAR